MLGLVTMVLLVLPFLLEVLVDLLGPIECDDIGINFLRWPSVSLLTRPVRPVVFRA